ncbi:MAG: hypothetical protein FWB91_07895 [Defluviitaleaceae bacterium]|nr:hypothetical protein [Defluviitaleaceae bacterium]
MSRRKKNGDGDFGTVLMSGNGESNSSVISFCVLFFIVSVAGTIFLFWLSNQLGYTQTIDSWTGRVISAERNNAWFFLRGIAIVTFIGEMVMMARAYSAGTSTQISVFEHGVSGKAVSPNFFTSWSYTTSDFKLTYDRISSVDVKEGVLSFSN